MLNNLKIKAILGRLSDSNWVIELYNIQNFGGLEGCWSKDNVRYLAHWTLLLNTCGKLMFNTAYIYCVQALNIARCLYLTLHTAAESRLCTLWDVFAQHYIHMLSPGSEYYRDVGAQHYIHLLYPGSECCGMLVFNTTYTCCVQALNIAALVPGIN